MDKKPPKEGPQLVQDDPKKKKDDPQLVQGAPKPDAGAAGGPPKGAEDEAEQMWAAKKKEDEELVDPNADRPDFASKPAAAEGAEEEEDDFGDFDGDDDAGPKVKVKRTPRRTNMAYVSAIIMGFAVILVGTTIWFGRDMIVKMLPSMAQFYERTNIDERPGDGLRIAPSGRRLTRIGGVETLVVKGFISNTTNLVKEVPKMSLQLINEKKEVIQSSEADAPTPMLNPGQSIEYELRLELPQLDRAKDYQVVWIE